MAVPDYPAGEDVPQQQQQQQLQQQQQQQQLQQHNEVITIIIIVFVANAIIPIIYLGAIYHLFHL